MNKLRIGDYLQDDTVYNQYPIGRYEEPGTIEKEMLPACIDTIALFPWELKMALDGLHDEQLDLPYRNGGWTVRQVVHHLADANINCFARIRFALTENNPVIKPFAEQQWAELSDAKRGPILPSLKILEGIHERWAALLENLAEEDWQKTFFHPDLGKSQTIAEAMARYSWHCRHHLAQIVNLKLTLR